MIHQIYTESRLRNFSYLIEASDGSIYCIDPFDPKQIEEFLGDKIQNLKAIINTHEHFDHTCGNKELVQKYKVEVWAHKNAKGKIDGVDLYLSGNDRIELGGNNYFQVLDTPGHTFAHLCLILFKEGSPYAVFTGDTLFNAGVGNCHNGGDPATLFETIKKYFFALPDDVLVYPGHEYLENNLGFTVNYEPENQVAKSLFQIVKQDNNPRNPRVLNMGDEREINTFLRLESSNIRQKLDLKEVDEKDVFLRLRELRNRW